MTLKTIIAEFMRECYLEGFNLDGCSLSVPDSVWLSLLTELSANATREHPRGIDVIRLNTDRGTVDVRRIAK